MSWQKILKGADPLWNHPGGKIEAPEGLQDYIESNFDKRRGFEGRWWAKYEEANSDQKMLINALFEINRQVHEGGAFPNRKPKLIRGMKMVIKVALEEVEYEDDSHISLDDDTRGEAEQERAGERAADSAAELQAERETEDRGFY